MGKWMKLAFSLWLCSLVAGGTAVAQKQAADASGKYLIELLARMKSNFSANGKLTQQYTSDELWHNRNFDKNGKVTLDESTKYENVFVEGLPYRRKVEANGKPLSGKEAEAEENRYEKAVKERRGMSLEEKRRGLHYSFHSSLPMCCLTTLFENRIVKNETINGRDTVVVESVPKAGTKPANEEEKSALNWKETTWIDAQDAMMARLEVESLTDRGRFAKGMTARIDFERRVDAPASEGRPEQTVWLQRDSISHARLKILWIDVADTTEDTWSNFKKFHVDMRFLDDSIQPLPDKGSSQQY
jgi:hypothetical protein